MKRLIKSSKLLLEKARDSATQAISTYNDPRSSFRTGNFVVLMIIAWTSLFHSYFEQNKIKYFYKKSNGRYETIDGERRAWGIEDSINEVLDENDPTRKNLELFTRIRHRIEHRNLPGLDQELLGECQALVLNFESWIIKEFGEEHSLMDYMFVPIQLTSARRMLPKTNLEEKIVDFIKQYRNLLEPEIINSQSYSFKAYLVPKIGNHRSSSDVAIEFIKYDEANPEEMQKYDKAIIAIKEKQVPVANANLYKPSQVLTKLGLKKGKMSWHTDMWKKYKVRPSKDDSRKHNCKYEYCVFDTAHSDYLYTDRWIELLKKEIPKKK